MKRTLVLSLILLCVTAGVQAQDARSEFMKNPALSGSNYVAYPGPKHRLTPAPRGYEPFYLSHYGRHGSRYLIDTHDYDRPYFTLLRADSLGKLTPRGRQVLDQVRQIRQEAMGRNGELTLLGAQQHKAIARRMYERFPQVFAGDAVIDAKSTVVIRCILSMENALQQLLVLNPRLRISHDASYHDMYYMNQTDKQLYKQKLAGGTKELLDSFRQRHQDYGHLMRVLFNHSAYPTHIKAADLADQLFTLASNVQSTELRHHLSLYSIFTPDEIYQHWLCNNAFWYLTYGPHTQNGGTQPFPQRNLLRHLIPQADS